MLTVNIKFDSSFLFRSEDIAVKKSITQQLNQGYNYIAVMEHTK